MSITFSGLATGLDTDSIVSQLMELEREPINNLKADKVWMQSRLSALTELDARMNSFLSKIDSLDSSDELRQKEATASSEDFFSVSAGVDALPGTSYQVEVKSLAQVQKSVSDAGFDDKTLDQFGSGSISITVGGEVENVTIEAGEGSLEGIMNAINDADIGVSAAIINVGSDTEPYRLVLTGEDVATSFTTPDLTGLSGGSAALGNFSVTQPSSQANIVVDNIEIFSDSNTISEAIPGVTIDLLSAEAGTTTNVDVRLDDDAIMSQIQDFVTGYNDVVSFISGQSKMDGGSGGILNGDSGVNSIKRRLQNMLTTTVNTSGVFKAMSQLGLETQKNGSLSLNKDTLSAALKDNLDSVELLLVGDENTDGIATQFKDFLEGQTSSTVGFLKGRSTSINAGISRIDDRIEQIELRLEHKEETMRAKFTSLETLISGMNAQSSYLSQQMDMLSNMMTGSK